MEQFLALLTGVLLGLFLVHVGQVVRYNACQRAGMLLCRVRLRRLPWFIMFIVLMVMVFLIIDSFFFLQDLDVSDAPSVTYMLSTHVMMIVVFLALCFRRPRVLEFWEGGCFLPGSVRILRWEKIRHCRWNDAHDSLVIMHSFYCMTLRLYSRDYEAVNEVLLAHVELRDRHYYVLNPEPEYHRERSVASSDSRFRFQFGLKTMLFLMVVVASASAWLGVHLRGGWQDEQLMQKLESFRPAVSYRGNRVYRLDFSRSAKKPSDDDLRYVAGLSRLKELDLGGCPITDEGLAHLTKLKHLERLNISNTKVTDAGLVHLAKIESLRHLYARSYSLPQSMCSEEALEKFQQKMPDLEEITH